jgi:tetratricopeptide (TPR) repeat protein
LKIPQVILIFVALAIGVIFYMTPIAPIPEKAEATEAVANTVEYNIQDDLTEIKNSLDSAALAEVNGWESSESEFALDTLIEFYNMLRKPVAAAFYALKRAEKSNTADHWTEAGERFLLNAKYMGDQAQKTDWFARSRTCFEKAVKLAPEDLDIQVDLGVCLMEGSTFLGTPPMEGIGMLINLGYFGIKSGQYEKAEGRFNQVIAIDKTYAEAYLYLADLHERQKLYKKAIADLENFKSLIDDPKKVNEVDDYILELSKNI